MESTDSVFFTDYVIAIVGMGLIGGSYAKGLRKLHVRSIIGIDVNQAALAEALADGSIDEASNDGSQLLGEADIVIFCMAADAMMAFIGQHRQDFKQGALLTDVAGIKGDSADRIRSLLRNDLDFVPGHPMAGREGSGYGMSRAEIFDGANYILVPMEGNKPEHVDVIERMARALGCAHVVRVGAAEHDKLIAYTSSLPHVLAISLINSESMDTMTRYFVAGSFRDGTRVADINAPLWTKLFLSNKDNLLKEIDRFSASLKAFAELLSDEDTKGMTQFLQQAALRRRELVHETNPR
mgnify:FL=1|jgi:prephenate dehydrogenase